MKYNILVTPDKEHKEDTDARLRLRIRWNNQVLNMLVGYRVIIDKWSYDAQRCKANSTHNGYTAAKINTAIERMCDNLKATFDHYDALNIIPTKDELKTYYLQQYTDKAPIDNRPQTLLALLDVFVKGVGIERSWSDDTYTKFNALKHHISDYKDIQLGKLDTAYLNGWLHFLSANLDMRNTSVLKQVGFMRWLLRWGDEHDYLQNKEWRTWHPKLKTSQKKVVFLSWTELMHVYTHPLEHEYQRHVRDVFCFCCFTGLRYSDVARLTHAHIYEDRISITSLKDHDSLEVNLNKYSKELLDRYSDFDDVKAMPVISNQKYNDYIKEVMRLCEINDPISVTYYKGNERHDETHEKWELISTHAARRTFICNALALGIPANVVIKWTGHSD